jgi:aspartate aminotransferase
MNSLHRPLEEFTQLHSATFRRLGSKAIDLSFPNPVGRRDDRAVNVLRRVTAELSADQLQYTPFGGLPTARRRVASALAGRVGVEFGHADVFLTPGATTALTVAFTAAFEPGDNVLIVAPCWMDYPIYLSTLGITWTIVPGTAGKRLDCAAVDSLWGTRTKAVIISQPNCPTGAVASQEELAELARVLRSHRSGGQPPPLLISDEVHRDQTWSGEFISPARVYDDTMIVYSFGKAWALQGQRTGYVAVSPRVARHPDILREISRALRSTGACAPTVVMQHVAAELAGHDPGQGSLAEDQAGARRALADAGVLLIDGQASVFVYARCPDNVDDWTFVQMAAEEGVLVMPSSVFYDTGHYRLALNVSGERLKEGIRRLIRAHERAFEQMRYRGEHVNKAC